MRLITLAMVAAFAVTILIFVRRGSMGLQESAGWESRQIEALRLPSKVHDMEGLAETGKRITVLNADANISPEGANVVESDKRNLAARVSGYVYTIDGRAANGALVVAQNAGFSGSPQAAKQKSSRVSPDGSYVLLLEPGNWKLGASTENDEDWSIVILTEVIDLLNPGESIALDLVLTSDRSVYGGVYYPQVPDILFGFRVIEGWSGGEIIASGVLPSSKSKMPQMVDDYEAASSHSSPILIHNIKPGVYRLEIFLDAKMKYRWSTAINTTDGDYDIGVNVLTFSDFSK